jgi:DNA-binding response OmpR family regulator
MAKVASPNSASGTGQNIALGPLRVLIADDDRDAVLTLRTILRQEGYEIRAVYRGDHVLQAAEDFTPDAVLLDINMPGMSGYDAARALRRAYGPDVVLIAITAWWKQPSDVMLARMVGFDHHFGKPYDVQALIGVLSALKPSLKFG